MKPRATRPAFPSIPSLVLALVVLVVLAVVDLSGFLPPAAAQIPHGTLYGKKLSEPYNTPLIRKYLTEGAFYHTVTVDSGGSGDFIKLSDAFAFVAAQNPTLTSRWSILVYPGKAIDSFYSLTEALNLIVPPYTSVQGIVAANGDALSVVSGQVWIKLTAPSGAALTLSAGSALANLGYSRPEAERSIDRAVRAADGAPFEDLLRRTLQILSGR